MTKQTLSYALTRPKVFIPALFGLGLLLGKVSLFWGFGFVAFAILQGSRLLSSPELDNLLRLRRDKRRHGIERLLNEPERQEILAIDRYQQKLCTSGADPELARDALEGAWEIIRDAGSRDASDTLRGYRHGLPPLEGGEDVRGPELAGRIQRELDILHATQKEMESIDLPEPEIIGRSTA